MAKYKIFVFFLALIFTLSCEDEINQLGESGTISGKIEAFDVNRKSLDDCSGFKVKLEGSSIEVSTNADGTFELEGVKSGTYNLVISKEAYGTVKVIGFQYLYRESPYIFKTIFMHELPIAKLSNMIVEPEFHWVNINADIEAVNFDMDHLKFRYFVHNKPDVSYMNYKYTGNFLCRTSYGFSTTLAFSSYFEKDETIYIVFYPISYSSYTYRDINTGLYIYSDVNKDYPSKIISYTNSK